jgi:hypothetical protein
VLSNKAPLPTCRVDIKGWEGNNFLTPIVLLFFFSSFFWLFLNTVARWPNFRPNNSKEAPKNCPWPEKLEAEKWQNFTKSGRKEAGK